MSDLRSTLVNAIAEDLVGPANGPEESLYDRPSDRYLTGVLYPSRVEPAVKEEMEAEEDDEQSDNDDGDVGDDRPAAMSGIARPSNMGVSFRIKGAQIVLSGTAATYKRKWQDKGGALVDKDLGRSNERWIRVPVKLANKTVDVVADLKKHETGIDGLCWWVRGLKTSDGWQVTVVLENCKASVPGRIEIEAASFFQTSFMVRPGKGGDLVPRQPSSKAADDDSVINDLLYRAVEEWAVGHVCSATWGDDGGHWVATTWMPTQLVRSMTAGGHQVFADFAVAAAGNLDEPFSASTLAAADAGALRKLLRVIPLAYAEWLKQERTRVKELAASGSLNASREACANTNLDEAEKVCSRISAGINIVTGDTTALRAFQCAQRAMAQQRAWVDARPFTWRPFQLAFQLLAVPGLVTPSADGKATIERTTMDLLWFPTGGGKTEAYLGLIAFLLFLRRFRSKNPDDGAGVATIMRYTLRLLTVQQFERAARMILACELQRRASPKALGLRPISIGLWVGAGATPNTIEDARTPEGRKKAQQLAVCPCCQKSTLRWDPAPQSAYVVLCENGDCTFSGAPLPIYTIDRLIYDESPSLLIATVDKFAQIVRKPETHSVFAGSKQPPDLIVQDELHLISGPLGTVVGLYECAIDQICSAGTVPPKIIGSTATIRRARDQVRSLFNRAVSQFPPPAVDWSDSCFAVLDNKSPGRLYVGLSSAGRSPKFALASLCAALLQRAHPSEAIFPNDAERDPYWTLVAYFNSLRELGGAHVMMLDDVNDAMDVFAQSHKATADEIEEPLELTSRIPSEDIPRYLKILEQGLPEQTERVVLATNMISVGVDIPRLGLMVVNGQPKSMAEYIQATSRVGRNEVPGVIVTLYNAGRARDRAHFESFRTWHQALYKGVEAASVTPFAPRARDKALHAAIVALARHLVPGMATDAALTPARRAILDGYVSQIRARAMACDFDEADDVQSQSTGVLNDWEARGGQRPYWDDSKPGVSLMISAEKKVELEALHGKYDHPALPTPNSMREVEASVKFRLVERLSAAPGTAAGPKTP